MKYGTFLIAVSFFNFIIIFSGFPTIWKKILITLTSLGLLSLGYLMRAQAKRRALKIAKQAHYVEEMRRQELDALTQEIAEDVTEHVEQEIDRL